MSWPKAIWVVADKWEQCKRFNEKMKTPFLGCCVCAGPELRSCPQVGQVGEQHPAWYYYVGTKWCCCTGWFKRSKAMCLCVQALEILQIWKSVCIYIYINTIAMHRRIWEWWFSLSASLCCYNNNEFEQKIMSLHRDLIRIVQVQSCVSHFILCVISPLTDVLIKHVMMGTFCMNSNKKTCKSYYQPDRNKE